MYFKESHIIPILLVLSAMFIALIVGCPMPGPTTADDTANPTPPGTMVAPTLTAGNGQLTVHWTEPADGGSPITGYELQYREVTILNIFAGIWSPDGNLDPESTATSHIITGLTNGSDYEVRARAVNDVGNGEWSEPTTEAAPVGNLPMQPTELVLTAGDGHIIAEWTAPTDTGGSPITGYELQYRTSGGAWSAPISAGTSTSHTITELTNDTEYDVRVYAVNSAGNGNPSESRTARTARTVIEGSPSAPTDLTLVAGNGQIIATWTAPTDDGGSPITGYELQYRTSSPQGQWTTSSSADSDVTDTSHTITGLTNGTEYEVQVYAVNSAGNGTPSESATATPTEAAPVGNLPMKPTTLELTAGIREISATWTAPTDDGGSAITGYELQHRTGGGAWSAPISAGTSTSHTIMNLTNDTEYEVQVRAVNAIGTGPWSTSATATLPDTPAAPTALTLTVGNGQISATWTAPSNNGGSAITGYELQYRTGSASWTQIASTDITGTSHIIMNLTNGSAYEVQVRAKNTVGNSDWSDTTSATLLDTPAKPVPPTLTAGNGQIIAEWTAPADGGSAINGYELQYRTGGGAWTQIASTDITGTSHTITGLTNGSAYDVQVRAKNTVGNSDWSDTTSATPDDIVPNRVPKPTLEVEDDKLKLTWTAPTPNEGSTITGYQIRYSTDSESNWTAPTTISSDALAPFSFKTALGSGLTFILQVRAVNMKGAGMWSESSNSVVHP